MPAKKKATTKKTTKKKIVKTKKVKKVAVKKIPTKKKSASKKVVKLAKKTKKKVVKKTVKKIVKKIVTPKAPKIKKIVAPQEFKAGENIVYPTHGVGRILTIAKFQYDLVEEQLYVIQFFQDKLTIRVPFAKAKLIGLRNITSKPSMTRTLSILKQKPKIKKAMWSRRAQEYDQKINSGKIYELAEVVKDLNKNTDIIADQSYSERQLFEKAYERLKSEFEAVLKTTPEEVQKKMDKALGRTAVLDTTE